MIVQWWGHATTTITIGGCRVLTDPVLGSRVAHLTRRAGDRPTADARAADLVVISHLHPDHFHVPSLRQLTPGTPIVVPRGAGGLVASAVPGLRPHLTEMTPGEELERNGITVRAVTAHHDGHRLPLSRYRAPALGFVLADVAQSVWFAGDTGLFDAMAAIGTVDVAVVPVGGWGPSLGPHHLDPEQAVEAAARVGARDAVPVHYGTFWPNGLHVGKQRYDQLFVSPGQRFVAAASSRPDGPRPHLLDHHGAIDIEPVLRQPGRARRRDETGHE